MTTHHQHVDHEHVEHVVEEPIHHDVTETRSVTNRGDPFALNAQMLVIGVALLAIVLIVAILAASPWDNGTRTIDVNPNQPQQEQQAPAQQSGNNTGGSNSGGGSGTQQNSGQ